MSKQRAALKTAKALRSLRNGLAHWRSISAPRKPSLVRAKADVAANVEIAPIPEDRVVAPRKTPGAKAGGAKALSQGWWAPRKTPGAKAAPKAPKASAKAKPADAEAGPVLCGGGVNAYDSADSDERDAVIEFSDDDDVDADFKADWKELAAAAERKAAAASEPTPPADVHGAASADDERRDSSGYIHAPHRPAPIGRICYYRQGTRTAAAHIFCHCGHGPCNRWVTLKYVPDRRLLVDWVFDGIDKTSVCDHRASFYRITKYGR